MSDSPPPAYSQIGDDPFVDNPFPPNQSRYNQPRLNQPAPQRTFDPRVRYGYGPAIPAPEDLVRPAAAPARGKYYVVPICPTPGIVLSWLEAQHLTSGVSCGTPEWYRSWDAALAIYTKLYNAGGIKVAHPSGSTSTSAHTASNPFVVHSTAPTPSPGSHIHPIMVNSSPAAAPLRTRGHADVSQNGTMAPSAHLAPTLTPSSPVATSAHVRSTPSTPVRDAATIKRHTYFERQFSKLAATPATTPSAAPHTSTPSQSEVSPTKSQPVVAGPSTPSIKEATWVDHTPVSIPRARIFSPPVAQDGRGSANDSDSDDEYFKKFPMSPAELSALANLDTQDGRDPDSDDEYFKKFPMSPAVVAALADLDDVLAEPRFAM